MSMMRTTGSGAAFVEDDDDRQDLPDREEIAVMEDYRVLWDLLDDCERACIRIETCLQYPGDFDRDWFFRARSALIMRRIVGRAAEKRMKELNKMRPGPSVVAVAPDDEATVMQKELRR